MGVKIEEVKNKLIIYGKGLNSLIEPKTQSILVIQEQVPDY